MEVDLLLQISLIVLFQSLFPELNSNKLIFFLRRPWSIFVCVDMLGKLQSSLNSSRKRRKKQHLSNRVPTRVAWAHRSCFLREAACGSLKATLSRAPLWTWISEEPCLHTSPPRTPMQRQTCRPRSLTSQRKPPMPLSTLGLLDASHWCMIAWRRLPSCKLWS